MNIFTGREIPIGRDKYVKNIDTILYKIKDKKFIKNQKSIEIINDLNYIKSKFIMEFKEETYEEELTIKEIELRIDYIKRFDDKLEKDIQKISFLIKSFKNYIDNESRLNQLILFNDIYCIDIYNINRYIYNKNDKNKNEKLDLKLLMIDNNNLDLKFNFLRYNLLNNICNIDYINEIKKLADEEFYKAILWIDDLFKNSKK